MRLWLNSTRGFRRFTRGSGVPRLRRSACCGLRCCSFSIRSARSGSWSNGWSSTCCFAVRRAYDRREGVRRLDLLEEPRPPAHARDRAGVSVFAPRPAGGEGASERRAFFGRRDFAQGLGVDEELPSQERLGRRRGERPGRAAASRAQPRGRLPQDQAIERTHASTTDKDARLYRKGAGQESRLCYLGHALMENRNGLVAAAEATLATGTAEREAAAAFSRRLPKGATLGADKGYDAEAFVEGLKARGIEPHIAINGTGASMARRARPRSRARSPRVCAMPSASGCASASRKASAGRRRSASHAGEGARPCQGPRRFRPRHGRLQHRAPAQALGPEGRSPASDMKSQRTTTRRHAKTPNLEPQKIALALLVAQTH